LSEVREITHQTLEKMRALSQMLHPAVLDDYGLSKGIEWYAGVFERQTGIQTIVIVRGDVVRITGQRATHCFRIVQEALNNAAKHADSKAAEVEVIFGPDSLEVNIRDFGKGLAQTKKKAGPGLGLIAMRERAELLNGRLDISSQPSQGTVISLVMPLRQEQEEDAAPESEENEPIQEVLLRDL
jgi:signal transduction histidine kinase